MYAAVVVVDGDSVGACNGVLLTLILLLRAQYAYCDSHCCGL